jgi:uracil-DNA glycosylase
MSGSAGPVTDYETLVGEIRACRICAPHLPLGANPVIRGLPSARLLIISQAPGTRVHETGLSFNDRSGDRLREWLGLEREAFYDERLVAIMGMGFCYPGRLPNGGDAPPRPECAPRWHVPFRALLPEIRLTLLVGSYALAYYLEEARRQSMTEIVAGWRDRLPDLLTLPHPSWRTTGWEKRNPWFRAELVPELRQRVAAVLT